MTVHFFFKCLVEFRNKFLVLGQPLIENFWLLIKILLNIIDLYKKLYFNVSTKID